MTPRAETTTRSRTHTAAHKAAAAEKAMDALKLLKEDHRHVEALFEQFESARKPERKRQIVQTLCAELTVHAQLEEKHFYPAVREALLKKDDHLLDEAEVEHAGVKALMAQLESESPDAQLYEAKVTVLKEYVHHHVKEEEKQLFPRIRKSALDTAALGEVLQRRKQELQQQLRPH